MDFPDAGVRFWTLDWWVQWCRGCLLASWGWVGDREEGEAAECKEAAAGDPFPSCRADRVPCGQKGSFQSPGTAFASSRVFSASLEFLRVLPLLEASLYLTFCALLRFQKADESRESQVVRVINFNQS